MTKTALQKNDVLKLIALITMFIDHVGYLIYPGVRVYRIIGRISFPIFAYMIAMGFIHTSNRKKYAKRLFVFGISIQVFFTGFALIFDPYSANPFEINVILLLFSGLVMLQIWTMMTKTIQEYKRNKTLSHFIKSMFTVLLFTFFTLMPRLLEIAYRHIYIEKYNMEFKLTFSYSSYGLILILIFYLFYKKPALLIATFVILSVFNAYISYSVYYADTNINDGKLQCIEKNISSIASLDVPKKDVNNLDKQNKLLVLSEKLRKLQWPFFQSLAIMGVLLILLLQNRKFSFTMPRYVAYVFYPAHLVFIYIIQMLFFN